MKTITCQDCQTVVPRTGVSQKYCVQCSEKRAEERKIRWGKANPRPPESKERRLARKNKARLTGELISSVNSKKSLSGNDPFIASSGWCVRFRFPYDQAVSKNHIWSLGGNGGHIYRRKSVNQYQDALALRTKAAMAGITVHTNKIWIELLVQKPSHKSDAVNVLDTVCDALKIGLGVDDRWFCIKQIDWEITKKDPQIYISIYQKDNFHAQACSHCGRILPLESFTKSKHNKTGRGRSCLDCRTGRVPEDAELLPIAIDETEPEI